MRIGLFTDMYLPHVSGVTNHVRLCKRRFEELGHEVYLFTFGDRDHQDTEPNVIRSPGIPWGDTGWRFSLAFSRRARAIIPTLHVAHVHHPFQSGLLALAACRPRAIPVVMTNHTRYDLYADAYARFIPPPVRRAVLRAALGRITRACDLVIAPTPSIREWLAAYCGFEGAVVVPNGIDVARFAAPEHPLDRTELDFSEENVVVCYVGRLGPEKNTEWLAREFVLAARAEPRLELLVVGDGPARTRAEAIIADAGLAERARFVGPQPYERVPDFEAVADIFVTGSVSEVHPLVILEAMAAGLPVVAVHSPGISDTVTDGVSGLLAPAVEPGALAERMVRIAQDPALRARLAAGARETAAAYSLERTADLVLAHYERLVRGPRR